MCTTPVAAYDPLVSKLLISLIPQQRSEENPGFKFSNKIAF